MHSVKERQASSLPTNSSGDREFLAEEACCQGTVGGATQNWGICGSSDCTLGRTDGPRKICGSVKGLPGPGPASAQAGTTPVLQTLGDYNGSGVRRRAFGTCRVNTRDVVLVRGAGLGRGVCVAGLCIN